MKVKTQILKTLLPSILIYMKKIDLNKTFLYGDNQDLLGGTALILINFLKKKDSLMSKI